MNTEKNHLLWIHQHPAMAEQLSDVLKQTEFEIISSNSRAQALDMLDQRTIDVILLDGDLPESAGNQ